MPIIFYPHEDDTKKGTLEQRLEVLAESADRYKATVLDSPASSERAHTPRDISISMNWDEMASVLKEIREMTESDEGDRHRKAHLLAKLADIYEVLRDARMSKLEAVRLALAAESQQIRNGR